ncbi:MAG TPA: tetratricopeptide repeat protein [Terriglobales bacterium]|nr:tetratricopeptide repeat protein [Terriglobales bacterium]
MRPLWSLQLTASFLLFVSCVAGLSAQSTFPPDRAIESALRQRDFQRALELAQSAVTQSPRDPKLLLFEGMSFSGLGRQNEALKAYDRALAVSPNYLPALEGAAELEYQSGSARAAPLLERIVKLRPDDPTANAMLGILKYKQHDCASAAKHFRAAIQMISSQPPALAQYGFCLMNLDKADEAVPVFQKVLDLQPEDTHSRYNLAVVELAAHRTKDAADTLQPLLSAPAPDPDVLDLASSAYEESGDTPKAVSLLRQAIVLDPKKVKYYVDFATLSFNHQSFQVGVDMVNVGLQENPKAAQLYVVRGILFIQLGQYDKGEADFRKATELDPGQTSGAVAEGLAQIQQSNLDEALVTVRAQLRAHPNDAFLHYLEAQILFQQGPDPENSQFKEAVIAAARSTQLNPDFALAHDLLGNLYLKSGEIAKSIAQSRLALQENPSDQEALYHLIQALRQSKGDKSELPALVKRLATLRQQERTAEAQGNRYKLYEGPPDRSPAQ